MLSLADQPTSSGADRIRRKTPLHLNLLIDRQTDSNIQSYTNSSHHTIRKRLRALDEEWDIERVLEINASTLALTGLVLGFAVNRKWFAVPAIALSLLLQQGVRGWCPPLPILRRMGIRTRSEINREKQALKALLDRR